MTKLALAALLIGLAACGGGKNDIVPIDVPPTGPRCDPRTHAGCEPGEKCATRFLQTSPSEIAEIACVPDGTVEIDGACTYGEAGVLGYSSCKAGGECVSGVCKQVCDHQGGSPMCDASHACSTYVNIFESDGKPVAGVCDVRCDPLTQVLAVGTKTAACGSTDPAVADTGCFTFDAVDYTCARIPAAARGLTDRMRAYGPSTGGAYVNGCAAGYIPWLYEQEGSMIVICSGLCAPAPTDNTAQNMPNAKGDAAALVKLPTKAAPEAGDGVCTADKKGSAEPEDCHYMWFWNRDSMGNLLPGPYNDTTGICFAYGKYNVTRAGAVHGWPPCEMLPPAGATADPVYGNANEWPCVPSTQAKLASPKLRSVASDFRLGVRPGPATRHILRQE